MNAQYSNEDLGHLFETIADLLEIKGEVIYKILAYRKAADSLYNLVQDVNDFWRQGTLTEIPGIGKAIAEKIDELISTGHLEFYERLQNEVPISLTDMLQVPDVGPKKVGIFWKNLGITTLAELETAARNGSLRDLPGMGEKSEAKVLAGIEALKRRSGRIALGKAYPFAQELLAFLRSLPGVEKAEAAGSLRRMRSTVGDLDLVVAAANSQPVMQAIAQHPDTLDVVSQGTTKISLEFRNNLRAQLWAFPPERFGTGLVYATGSKDHNVRLRELAIKKNLSLSDASFQKSDGSEILCANEEDVYAHIGLPWIPPELREDRGEIQAALSGNLPKLIEIGDIRSDLHTHSTWTDGRLSVREMAEAAISRGYAVLAITDHSASLGIAGGLSIEAIHQQRDEILQVQKELGNRIRLLWGSEVEIKADGSLDYPDEVLAEMDVVIASLHTGLRQPRQQVTDRLIRAIQNPHVDIIGHPTGRLLPNRDGADLDMESVLQAAAQSGVALEINAHPSRLDLDAPYARRAAELGVLLSINTDAHTSSDFDLLPFGMATARRGWLEAANVINTWEDKDLLGFLNRTTYQRA
jgi:DNA polymerase (family 10)